MDGGSVGVAGAFTYLTDDPRLSHLMAQMVQDIGSGNQSQKIIAVHHGRLWLHVQHCDEIVDARILVELNVGRLYRVFDRRFHQFRLAEYELHYFVFG